MEENNEKDPTSEKEKNDRDEKTIDHTKRSKKELVRLIAEKDARLADLYTKLERFEILKNQHIRLEADFINFRKRHQKERQDLIQNTREDLIINFLNVKTNLDRAFDQIENAKNIEGLRKGLSMVELQLNQFLGSFGVREISGEGGCFDPNFQEAVTSVVDENVKEETVVKMVEKGYLLNEKVIIPMKCIVSIPPENTTADEE